MDANIEASAPSRPSAWLRLVGPVVAVALLWRVDLVQVRDSLAAARWHYVAASLVLVAPLLLLKAWRWRLLLRACGRPVSLRDALWLYTIAAGAGSVTPGAVGDFWKALSPIVGKPSVGLWASFIDRLYDLAIVILLALVVSVAWLHGNQSKALGAALLFASVAFLWAFRGRLLAAAASLLPRFPQSAGALHRSTPAAVGATVAATLVALLRFQLLVTALAMPIRWSQSLIAFVLTSGVAALPLSVAGVGTRDLALVGYLRGCGVASPDAIALSSLCLLQFVWNGVVAACLWLFEPPSRRTIP